MRDSAKVPIPEGWEAMPFDDLCIAVAQTGGHITIDIGSTEVHINSRTGVGVEFIPNVNVHVEWTISNRGQRTEVEARAYGDTPMKTLYWAIRSVVEGKFASVTYAQDEQ